MTVAEVKVLGMLQGEPVPSTLAQWVDEYNRLEHETDMGRGSKVIDERMNMIYDYLIAVIERNEHVCD